MGWVSLYHLNEQWNRGEFSNENWYAITEGKLNVPQTTGGGLSLSYKHKHKVHDVYKKRVFCPACLAASFFKYGYSLILISLLLALEARNALNSG